MDHQILVSDWDNNTTYKLDAELLFLREES